MKQNMGWPVLALLVVWSAARAGEAPPKPDTAKPVDYLAWINQTFAVPEEKNAAEPYRKAIDAAGIPDPEQIPKPESFSADEREAAQRLISANAASLDLLTQASGKPACSFSMVSKSEPYDRWGSDPRNVKLRHLCRVLAVRARLHSLESRHAAAVDDLGTILRVARHLADQPALVDYLISLGCAELAYQQVGLAAESISDSEHVAYLVTQLERADGNPVPSPDRAIAGEWALAYERLQKLLKDINGDGNCDTWVIPGEFPKVLAAPMSFDAAVERTARTAERWRAILSEPVLPRAMLDADALTRELDADKGGDLEFGFPRIGHLVALRGRVVVRRAGAPVVTALHEFKRRHGRWPKDLDELGAARPQLALADPFIPSSKLRYRLDESGPVLYSVGANARDDGGKTEGLEGDIVLWPPVERSKRP